MWSNAYFLPHQGMYFTPVSSIDVIKSDAFKLCTKIVNVCM